MIVVDVVNKKFKIIYIDISNRQFSLVTCFYLIIIYSDKTLYMIYIPVQVVTFVVVVVVNVFYTCLYAKIFFMSNLPSISHKVMLNWTILHLKYPF